MKILVDRTRCMGVGMCESLSPQHFAVQDDGILTVSDDVPDGDAPAMDEAARACPTQALSVIR